MSTPLLPRGNKSDRLLRSDHKQNLTRQPRLLAGPAHLAPPTDAQNRCETWQKKHIKNKFSDGEQKADGHKTQLGMQNTCGIYLSFWCNIFSFVAKVYLRFRSGVVSLVSFDSFPAPQMFGLRSCPNLAASFTICSAAFKHRTEAGFLKCLFKKIEKTYIKKKQGIHLSVFT